ncbi:hypothetical protein [Streptomyces sp. NPDC087294]|uniref:hypothetical protein n=1 Tax=Streptomyces sp. NPDC087294 TaxID=3365777 RepID=UPI0038135FA6
MNAQQHTLSAQLDKFHGDNGLFVNSFAAVNEPGLYQSAYGLSALRAGGQPVLVSLSGREVRRQLLPWLEKDPLWGRYYFALLERATGKAVHTDDDVQTLRRMLTRDGYFRDPSPESPQDPTAPLKLSQTTAALEALKQFGSPLVSEDAARVADWLRAYPEPSQPQMVVEYNLARAFELVGMPVPKTVTTRVKSWTPAEKAASAEERSTQLTDTAAYVLAAGITKVDLSSRRSELKEILSPGSGDLVDPQMVWMVARALAALPHEQRAADAVSSSVAPHLLKSGLISKAQSHQGTLDASYQAERLRMAAGLPTEDGNVRRGLERARTEVFSQGTAVDRATWLVTYRLSGGKVSAEDEKSIGVAAREQFPRTVSVENVQAWSHQVDVLELMDEPIPGFAVKPWEATDPQSRSARDILVFNLWRLKRTSLLGALPTPRELIDEAGAQLRTGSVTAASIAVDAASSVGWVTDETTSRRMRKQLADRTGCAEGSLLVRDSGSDDCSISATLAAARLSNLLEVPGGGHPESEERT